MGSRPCGGDWLQRLAAAAQLGTRQVGRAPVYGRSQRVGRTRPEICVAPDVIHEDKAVRGRLPAPCTSRKTQKAR